MTGAAEDIAGWNCRRRPERPEPGRSAGRLLRAPERRRRAAWRASIGADTLHPLIVAQGHRWLAGGGVHEQAYAPDESQTG